ncbi:hypothetical protein N7510_011373 [Penicillium lagena]|uniref:uncharacterized protein n=1 Tax=Penicillium lagena TaxID=94218 RepID=UPI00254183D8|nr:uncharacterized protein N7510_011373 [Penicillium lagena]KAJ5601839.1 hypothetical protein N7510_011373 [Penicillium lagena]
MIREKAERSEFRRLVERARYMERILKHTMKGIKLDTESLGKLADALDADEETTPAVVSDPQHSEGLRLDDEACTMEPVGDSTTPADFSGEFSYWNFSMRIKSRIESHIKETESRVCFMLATVVDLLNTFFKFAETHYFFAEESWVLETVNSLYTNPESFYKNGSEVTISILLTVFAIGTQYSHLESSRQGSISAPGSTFSEDDVGATFYQHAIRLLPEIIEISSLESVQACLLFGYYALPVDASGLGFIYINLAMRLGMQNGMHRKCKNEAFSPAMIETRNRVWWTAYALESNLLRHCQMQGACKIVLRLLAMKSAFTKWWASLPSDALNNETLESAHIRSAMHLRLEYCLIRMFVGRPFLLKQETSDSSTSSPAQMNNTTESHPRITEGGSHRSMIGRKDLINDCIQAANEALDICQRLRDSGIGLARASYIEYSSCRASLLVLIAYSIQSFSEQFRKPLYNGLTMIREMSAAGESARSEVSLIESLERALARLHTATKHRELGNIQEKSVSDYEAFKKWGTNLTERSESRSSGSDPDPLACQVGENGLPSSRPTAFDTYLNPSFTIDGDIFNGIDPSIEMFILGAETFSPSTEWPTYNEAQVLGQFLTDPNFVADEGT